MLLRTFAIELAWRNPRAVCVGLHPGTVDTPLSAPFQANVPKGKLLDRLTPEDSGKVFAWDGEIVPP